MTLLRSIGNGIVVPNRIITATSGTRNNHALDSAFVNGVSGDAIGWVMSAPALEPINEFYCFTDLTTGTRGNVSLQCLITNAGANNTRCGTTVLATSSATVYPASDDRWVKFTFDTPYTPSSINEVLWAVVHNQAGVPATDFPSIMRETTTAYRNPTFGRGVTTTTGFSTNGTVNNEAPFVIQFGSDYYGLPFTQLSTSLSGNNTRKRGFIISDILKYFPILSVGTHPTALATTTTVQIYDATTPPSGSPLIDLSGDWVSYRKVRNPATLLSGTGPFKVVWAPAANGTSWIASEIQGYSDYPAVFDSLYDYWHMCPSVQDNGAGGWTTFFNHSSEGALIVGPPEIPSGGGGPLYLPRGFTGGFDD
jgi:hypothetical protein